MPEWSKGDDLRSSGESLAGSNPAPSIHRLVVKRISLWTSNPTFRVRFPASLSTHSSVVERKLSKLEVRGSKPLECKKYPLNTG